MKILLADDDVVSRRLLQSTLTKLGHDVTVVSDGAQAEAALAVPGAPQLALLDWMMPGADGLAVCRALRQRTGPYVYVILITGKCRREDMLTGFEAGVDDFLAKPVDALELLARLRSGERVLALQERLLRTQEALRTEATHDRLTGLWNRGAILDRLEREGRRIAREGGSLGLALVDIDHFKRINDSHGHPAGDAVLRETAMRMKNVLRDYEILGRYGGEEFLILLPGCTEAAVRRVAERARAAVAATPIPIDGDVVPTTISVGVAWTDQTTQPAATVVQAADDALYRAKANGRNRVESASDLPTVGADLSRQPLQAAPRELSIAGPRA